MAAWFACGAVRLLGETVPAAAAATPRLDFGFSLLRLSGAFALVLALFFAGVWCFKNWQRVALHRGRSPKLSILEVKSLGSRQALYVVGYEQQRLLLASSPSGITLVSLLQPAGSEGPAPAMIPFQDVLRQTVGAKP